MSRRTATTLAATLIALLIAFGGYLAGRSNIGLKADKKDDKAASAPKSPAPPPGPPTVTLDPEQLQYAELKMGVARAATLPTRLTVLGTVTPNVNGTAQVPARLSGKIVQVLVNVGQSVHAGQTLAIVSSPELFTAQAAYRDALLRRTATSEVLARQIRLGRLGQYGRASLETARVNAAQSQGEIQGDQDAVITSEAQVASAKAQINLTQKQYARAQLLSQNQLLSRQDLEQSEANAQNAAATLVSANASLTAAHDRLQNARNRGAVFLRELTRQSALYQSGTLTAEQVGPARSAYTLAAHEVEAAAAQIHLLGGPVADEASPEGGMLPVAAPIDGRVSARFLSPGESAMPDKPILSIINLRSVVVQLNIYQEDSTHLRVGQPVLVVSNAAPGRNYRGVISVIGLNVDPNTRTVPVYCAISNADGALRPGVYVAGTITGAARTDVVAVPREAVQTLDSGPAVFVPGSKPGVYVAQPVQTGETVGGLTQIKSGLTSGATVVTQNAFLLKSQLLKEST